MMEPQKKFDKPLGVVWDTPGTYYYIILDGNSEVCAHVRSNLCYLICLRQLIRSRAATNRIFSLQKDFFPSCMRNMF